MAGHRRTARGLRQAPPDGEGRYRRFVADGVGAEPIWNDVNGQAFLGDDAFVARSLRHGDKRDDVNIPKAQRRPPPPSLDTAARKHSDREKAIMAAHASGGYSYQQIGEYSGVHFTTEGRIVRAAKSRDA